MAYKNKVVEIFDTFIASVDDTVRDAAEKFFYPDNEVINFKSSNFKYFSDFAKATAHINLAVLNEHYQSAKKYYFSLLMGSGGQTGIKKKLKEAVQQSGFVYSHANIDEEITKAAIDSCIIDANSLHRINDNSIKYVISQEAMDYICQLSCTRVVNESDVRQAMTNFPHKNPKFRGIENDMIAFIRNERQVLYYYGYFHSKTSGATDFEFSSLTPVGELAIRANYYEFLAIWEHQKIKMISQPVTVDINDIKGLAKDSAKFDISTTPYTDILDSLIRHNSFSLGEYKYIISRRKDTFDRQSWRNEEETLFSNFDKIKNKVDGFGRKRDKEDEDARMELLKYILGIRCDLMADAGTNPLNILNFKNSIVTVQDTKSLILLFCIYSHLDDYKKLRYSSVYNEAKDNLQSRYKSVLRGISVPINSRAKIHWDLYNIHPDKFIMLGAIVVMAAISFHCTEIENIDRASINNLCQFISGKFSSLLRKLGIRSFSAIKREINKFITAIKNEDYTGYLEVDKIHENQALATYRAEDVTDLKKRIEQISNEACVEQSIERERNMNLIKLLKSYYMACYANDNKLTCECCGETTFITENGEPYVEFHHLIPFNIAYGPDHYLNLFALCPNCHRRIHFLKIDEKHNEYENLSNNNYLHLSFLKRLMMLKAQNLLKSYHLEYLLIDNAITQDEYEQIAS